MESEYQVIESLPSHFRLYEFDQVQVRGLYFIEALSLAKYIGNLDPDYSQLANLYKDVIKLPSGELEDLELVDFSTLVTISSILSMERFEWDPNLPCPDCKNIIHSKITLDDFDFQSPTIKNIPKDGIELEGVKVKPLTLRSKIEESRYLNSHENVDDISKILLSYSIHINGGRTEDKMEMIGKLPAKKVSQINQMISDLKLHLSPVVKKCPKCGREVKMVIDLSQLKVYP